MHFPTVETIKHVTQLSWQRLPGIVRSWLWRGSGHLHTRTRTAAAAAAAAGCFVVAAAVRCGWHSVAATAAAAADFAILVAALLGHWFGLLISGPTLCCSLFVNIRISCVGELVLHLAVTNTKFISLLFLSLPNSLATTATFAATMALGLAFATTAAFAMSALVGLHEVEYITIFHHSFLGANK